MPAWSIITPATDTTLRIAAGERGICSVFFITSCSEIPAGDGERRDRHPLIREAARQLKLYFQGKLRDFDLPLEMEGTPFQRKVWSYLQTIPYGQTRSYGQLAAAIGNPNASRAVGAANGQNPIPIIVPCHRVINSDGGLGGFSCGLAYKQRLLELEGARTYRLL